MSRTPDGGRDARTVSIFVDRPSVAEVYADRYPRNGRVGSAHSIGDVAERTDESAGRLDALGTLTAEDPYGVTDGVAAR